MQPFVLSTDDLESMAIRGSFLHERTDNNKRNHFFTLYIPTLDRLQQELGNGPVFVKNYISGLCRQAESTPDILRVPDWYSHLQAALEVQPSAEEVFLLKTWPFVNALSPFVAAFMRSLEPKITQGRHIGRENILKTVAKTFYGRILNIAGATLYVDYRNFCAQNNQAPSEGIFKVWEDRMLADGWLKIAFTYPILVRFLYEENQNFSAMISEILDRLASDIDEFTLFSHEPYILKDVCIDMSDFHNSGRTVCKLVFNRGRTLFYKPKPVMNEKWFYDRFLPNLNLTSKVFGRIKVLQKEGYGWVEDISSIKEEHLALTSQECLARTISLFYALNATDMHDDNLLRQEGRTYPVDLETILNAARKNIGGVSAKEGWKQLGVMATEMLSKGVAIGAGQESFTEVGFIPFKKIAFNSCPKEGVNIQFLEPPQPAEGWVDAQKCNKSYDRTLMVGDFISTFEEVRTFALKEGFFDDGLLNSCIVRSVPRDTNLYARILARLQQPRLLTDGALISLDLSDIFLALKDADAETADMQGPIFYDEILQLLRRDVPYFWHEAASRDLMSSNGLVVRDYFVRSGLEEFKAKMHKVELPDLLIEGRLMCASLNLEWRPEKIARCGGVARETTRDLRAVTLDFCEKLVAAFLAEAVVYGEARPAQWVSYTVNKGGKHFRPSIIDESYYGGYWGILLFLIAAQKVFKSEMRANVPLDDFLESELRYWKSNPNKCLEITGLPSFGLSNYGGRLIALSSIYECNPEWSFVSTAFDSFFMNLKNENVFQDTLIDVIAGNAGFILALVTVSDSKLFSNLPENVKDKIPHFALMAAERMLELVLEQEVGSGWVPENGEETSLLGFAHGNAGCIAALQLLLNRADFFAINNSLQEDITKAITGALTYQDSQRMPDRKNWKDLRKNDGQSFPLNESWCHGVPGLGLGLLTQTHLAFSGEAIETALNFCLQEKPQTFGFYCCGESGGIDFLLEASRVYEDRLELKPQAAEKMLLLLQSIMQNDKFESRVGSLGTEAFPSLFQGSAGIGYTALRFLDEDLPNICGFKPR